jgi:hypothetical protein
MSISEHNELKEQFGQLGVNLINTAKKQIKELNQNTLFQKSQIKKNLLKRNNENSLRTKTHFIETYVQLLNNALASTLLETKQEVLEIKNTLLNELRLDLLKRIESNINNNYENYVIYLINELKEFAQTIKSSYKKLCPFRREVNSGTWNKKLTGKLQNAFSSYTRWK